MSIQRKFFNSLAHGLFSDVISKRAGEALILHQSLITVKPFDLVRPFDSAQGRQAGLLVPLLSETTFQKNPGLGFNALLPYAQTLRDKIIAYYAGRLFA